MGVSTDAILFYGYCWDEEDVPAPWKTDDEEEDWEARYASARGCPPPSAPYPERTDGLVDRYLRATGYGATNYSAAERAIIDRYTAYWDEQRAIVEASSCEVGTHCSASCPMAYVAVRTSVTTSHRGYPQKITTLAVDPAWADQLAEFCAIMKISTKRKKAAWWLVSDWSE